MVMVDRSLSTIGIAIVMIWRRLRSTILTLARSNSILASAILIVSEEFT